MGTSAFSKAVTASEAHSADDILVALGREFDAISRDLDDVTSRKHPQVEREQQSHFLMVDELQTRLGSLEAGILAQHAKRWRV